MELKIIVVRDIKADVFMQPQFVSSLGAAIRSFGDECQRQDENNILWKHPEDFELYHIGNWDDNSGSFDVEHDGSGFDRKQIAVGSNYKR